MKTTFPALLLPFCAAIAGVTAIEPGAVLLENDQVKVVRALEKAHIKGKFHEHKSNRVMVYLQPGRQKFEYQDSRKTESFDWKAGQVIWSPASGLHSPEVVSDDNFNIVEVECKNAGSGAHIDTSLDPVKVDPKHYKVEFENDQVRVVRVKVGPHESIPMHEHILNRVTVFLTDQVDQLTSADGKTDKAEHKAGEVAWGTPLKHSEQNLSDQPFELLIVEVKS